MAPASPTYERLEGGNLHGAPTSRNRFASASRLSWRKGAIAGAIMLGLIWFTTGGSSGTMPAYDVEPANEGYETPRPTPPYHGVPSHEDTTPNHDEPVSDDSDVDLVHPTSFETDQDPLSTTYCKTPRASHLPLVQYALMIDAGSTGSRIHIYKFNNCPSDSSSPIYEYETFQQIQPGLSSFASAPPEAANSLEPLLKLALERVPSSLHSCTPIAVKATAGLRRLGEQKSQAILEEVTKLLDKQYPFTVQSVEVMDGREEGVYAWITANYLLGTLASKEESYAVLDLGGASTQIVFEPTFHNADQKMTEGEHKYELTYGENAGKRELYQHSYLGYGLMVARSHVHKLVQFVDTQLGEDEKEAVSSTSINNPCFTKNMHKPIVVDEKAGIEIEMKGEDVGSYEACKRLVEIVLGKDRICASKPCSFNGVYQPSLLDTFLGTPDNTKEEVKKANNGRVLLLSYFFDRVDMLLPFNIDVATHQSLQTDNDPDSTTLTLSTIADLARVVCNGNKGGEWDRYWTDKKVLADLAGRPEHCLDLTFIHTLLSLGYEFPENQEMKVAKRVNGTELGWCLGATVVELLGGDVKCTKTS